MVVHTHVHSIYGYCHCYQLHGIISATLVSVYGAIKLSVVDLCIGGHFSSVGHFIKCSNVAHHVILKLLALLHSSCQSSLHSMLYYGQSSAFTLI